MTKKVAQTAGWVMIEKTGREQVEGRRKGNRCLLHIQVRYLRGGWVESRTWAGVEEVRVMQRVFETVELWKISW